MGDSWRRHLRVHEIKGAPASWPSDLHWSKWEAYSTWLSGMLLLTLVYYLKAELYLYGSLEWMRTPLRAVLASLSVLAVLS